MTTLTLQVTEVLFDFDDEDFTPEKREFYKNIIKKIYIKWKPLIEESIKEADQEINK